MPKYIETFELSELRGTQRMAAEEKILQDHFSPLEPFQLKREGEKYLFSKNGAKRALKTYFSDMLSDRLTAEEKELIEFARGFKQLDPDYFEQVKEIINQKL